MACPIVFQNPKDAAWTGNFFLVQNINVRFHFQESGVSNNVLVLRNVPEVLTSSQKKLHPRYLKPSIWPDLLNKFDLVSQSLLARHMSLCPGFVLNHGKDCDWYSSGQVRMYNILYVQQANYWLNLTLE